jgi:histidinol dehydrogenase
MITEIDGRGMELERILTLLRGPSHLDYDIENRIVKEIIGSIRERGESALLEYIEQLDGVSYRSTSEMLVSKREIDMAYDHTPSSLVDTIRRSRDRIWSYHVKQKRNSWISYEDEAEIILGQRILPLEKAGIYVPGGRAAYPSSVLMNAIPARIAGVSEIIMVTPPGPDGSINPYTLVAADIVGVDRIYKMGGAQSIAALAFGIGSIPRVDKITGPGNIYVTLAKKEVYGYVDIDMIAGPSEVVVLADSSADPVYVAADLLSQAEHDPLAISILITDDYRLAQETIEEIKKQVATLPKADIIRDSLKNNGGIVLVDSINQGLNLVNGIAPEHLELAVENPLGLLGKIKHAGSIFLGNYSPEALGDYMAGPNHILPTSGSARFFSSLSVDDFIKKSSFISYSRKALYNLKEDIARFARAEGLVAHARSVEVRFDEDD